jgi:predicted SAM-dependent methyltransferase
MVDTRGASRRRATHSHGDRIATPRATHSHGDRIATPRVIVAAGEGSMDYLGYHSFETPRFRWLARAEITGWIGRHFLKSRSRIRPAREPALLDLGVGENFTDGWIHVDYFRVPLRFWRRDPEARLPEVQADLRFPLDCPSGSIDGAYSGHTLEHLYPREALRLLREVLRVLKPGAWFRINVPDIEKYVAFYAGSETPPGFEAFESGAEAISFTTQQHGHHSVWDEKTLGRTLREIGFTSERRVAFGTEGTDRRLIKEEAGRRWETLVMEAQKPA